MLSSQSLCVLIIEDDPLMALLLKELLESYDYVVETLTGVIDDALELLSSRQYDFVVLDVRLHSYDAYEIAELLIQKQIPFAFSTGVHRSSIHSRYQNIPFLQKPYDIELLHDIVEGFVNLQRNDNQKSIIAKPIQL